MTRTNFPGAVAVLIALSLLAACGGPHVHKDEMFELDSQYQRNLDVQADVACQAAKRALLSQGYTIDNEEMDAVKAHKAFTPEDETMTVLEFSVTCLPNNLRSVIFANAEESVYRLKKTRESLGVGVSSIGSIKLPWGKQLDSLVKTEGKTIDDKKFYTRFFNLVEQIASTTRSYRYR